MQFIQTRPRKCYLQSLASKAGALLLAVAALSGCVEAYSGPVVAPSEPMFIGDSEPRALGPLQRVAESDVHLVRKDVPFGTIAVSTSTFDMDTTVRASNALRTVEMRFTEHQGRAMRVQSLEETPEGFFRFRLEYLKDKSISLPEETEDAKPSPVAGNTYFLEVGFEGARAVGDGGRILDADEIKILKEDIGYLRSLVANKNHETDAPVTVDSVTQSVREAFDREGMEVEDIKVSYKGVRSVGGEPCVVFDIRVASVMRKSEPDRNVVIRLKLAGEYARRVADGWEADGFLTGTTTTTGSIIKDGDVIRVDAAGHARIHIAVKYRLPDMPSFSGSVAGL
jgi:hypothetical protein